MLEGEEAVRRVRTSVHECTPRVHAPTSLHNEDYTYVGQRVGNDFCADKGHNVFSFSVIFVDGVGRRIN